MQGADRSRALQIIALACLAHVLSVAHHATFPALIPLFQAEWGLSNSESGWISGVFFAGYLLGVPVLVPATDSLDPRRIYVASALVGGLATLAFAWLAQGFWSALLLRALAGLGMAGTFMVGLRLVTDRLSGRWESRGASWYLASFSIGLAISTFLAGELASLGGWPLAFLVAGLLSTGSVLPALLLPRVTGMRQPAPVARPLDLRPALRNRAALGYNIAYACHTWELFGWRSWLVAFLVFAFAWHGQEGVAGFGPTQWASLFLMLGLPASILGNEAALRWGRRRTLTLVMLASAALAAGLGFAAVLPPALLLLLVACHAILVMADSSALTAGAVAAATTRRGATMAVHSLLGFTFAFIAPLVAGLLLDLGGDTPLGWGLALASLGLVAACGPLALRYSARHQAFPAA
ncbi:MFS transporter [Aquibaculum sediminis]|uniref:MFS transporter n=1 Tax=Aquibaculum sediminis TaxID=3231907 RepID=UPI00345221AD